MPKENKNYSVDEVAAAQEIVNDHLAALDFDPECFCETYEEIAEVEPQDVSDDTIRNIDDIARAILAELATKVDAIVLDKFQM